MQLNPYLQFDGRCAEAFRFYADCVGGTIVAMITHGESPMAAQTPSGWHDRIMHARMLLGTQVLMGSDAPPEQYRRAQGFHVALGVEQPAEAERLFAAIADGGTVQMPIQETFWAHRFGMVVDRFGIPWMLNCEKSG
jgi:PhnB protein